MTERGEDAALLQRVCAATGARAARWGAQIQSLWSGYGAIVRAHLEGGPVGSVVVKRVQPPRGERGRSHARKLRSYDVESTWYRSFAKRCGAGCRVPRALACEALDDGWLFVLEDLDAAGFDGRRGWRLGDEERARCLSWLASFHATFLGVAPHGLWPVGTYWHLATRPDELAALRDPRLRAAAAHLDSALSSALFQTLVHGDAKLANFCFGPDAVAAVDFQYVGGGCGMKDVAYFLSCLDDQLLSAHGDRLLGGYFRDLRAALAKRDVAIDADALEVEWRALYPAAWADLQRFLDGWAPGHYAPGRYARRQITQALRAL